MPIKREVSEDADDTVPRDPRDTVRAILPEPQSPAMKANIPRPQRLMSGHCDRAAKSSSLELSAQWAVRSDLTEGDGRGTYVALDTSGIEGIWDHLQGASPKVTEPP
jgi:hypothetical protein